MNRQRKLAKMMKKPKTKQQIVKEKVSYFIQNTKNNVKKTKGQIMYKVTKSRKAHKPQFVRGVAKLAVVSLLAWGLYSKNAENIKEVYAFTMEDDATLLTSSLLANEEVNDVIEDIEEEVQKKERIEAAKRKVEAERRMIENQYDQAIAQFSYYFNLNSYHVVKIARELTNDYRNFDGLYEEDTFTFDDIEARAMAFVYNLSKDDLNIPLKDMGYILETPTKENADYTPLITTNNIVCFGDVDSSQFIMRNGMHLREYIGKISDLLGLDKTYVLSIHFAEAGKDGSRLLREQNNVGGLRGSGDHMTFPSPEAGVIAFCSNLKKYENYNIRSLSQLSGIYVNGNRNNPSEHWMSMVHRFHEEILETPEAFFGKSTQEGVILLEMTL